MLFLVLFVIGGGFLLYALVTQYQSTPADQSIPKRVLAAVVAATAVISATISAWFHSGATP